MTISFPTPRWQRRSVLGAGLACAVVRPHLALAAGDEAGLVTGLQGRVTATLAGATRTLHQGAVVHRQDSLATAAGARLKVTLADGSTLAMGESSRLVVSVVVGEVGEGRGVVLDLVAGIVRAVLGPSRPEVFEVRGRVAVAAARATDFIVETETSRTAVFAATGAVEVREAYGAGEAVLGAGEGIDVVRGVELGEPRRWGQGRVDQFVERTTVVG